MKYKIDNRIIYRTDDGLLWLIDNEKEVLTLSPTTNRLLNALINERGVAMSRELLLSRVWDDYGLVSSSNSLNQYISHLRKALKSVGLDEHIIKTVPKIGVEFSTDVTVEVIEPTIHTHSDPESNEKINLLPGQLKNKKVAPIILLAIVSISIFMFTVLYTSEEKNIEPYEVGMIDSCRVFSLNSGVMVSKLRLNNMVVKYMNEHHLGCKKGNDIYFHGDHKLFASGRGKIYMALCALRNDGSVSNCENYLTQDWVEKS